MAICKLCLKDKILLKESHIIPEFLYKQSQLYNTNHNFISTDISKLIENKKTFIPKGEYEAEILCQNCDNIVIGKNEDYVKKAFFEKFLNSNHIFKSIGLFKGIIEFEYVDYSKFKLFLLSILWRASISTRPFFKNIKLNKEQEESLRCMILNKNPKSFSTFPTIIFSSKYDTDFSIKIIIEPYQWYSKEDNTLTCRFFIGEFVFLFKITESYNTEIKDLIITENNILKIILLDNGQTAKIIESETNIKIN